MGFVSPALFTGMGIDNRRLHFQAVQRELIAHIETGSILSALAVSHPFVLDAKDRMNVDQFRSCEVVVFDEGYLQKLTSSRLSGAFERSAKSWRT
ncbi:hypothetical protein J4729_08325 [Leisingera sp. HS039]|uniref:hypothetical protein n=1 Tax=unclassified Leisingera TaxID=2614906 RepID=UPI0010711664|nr:MULTISPECIES: hypothetical protein [unclassified Leisingera]MBQ4824552.1 hypothetical protein [Leisingera sp. HS039]QBR38782.1 hypothetical protein ETW23_23200 [Leisingera sp. NJS201]